MTVVTGTFCLSTVLSLLQRSVWIFSSNSSPVTGLLDCYRNTSCNCTLTRVWSLYRLGCILACLLAFQESLSFCFCFFVFVGLGKEKETRNALFPTRLSFHLLASVFPTYFRSLHKRTKMTSVILFETKTTTAATAV